MSTLDEWLREATTALKLPADSITADLRNDLLDLTRDVAHGVARVAGPLTCYLLGMAAARGVAPSAAIADISTLALAHLAEQPVDAAGHHAAEPNE